MFMGCGDHLPSEPYAQLFPILLENVNMVCTEVPTALTFFVNNKSFFLFRLRSKTKRKEGEGEGEY